MKNLKSVLVAILFLAVGAMYAQVQQVDLTQQKGIFTTESLTLDAGEYQFNILNENVGHDVGFVLVPKGMYDASKHIKEAYVKAPVANNSSSMTNVVNLAPGEYEYFCPMNKTPKYTLTVKESMDKSMGKKAMMDKSHSMDKSDKMDKKM